MIFEQYGSRSGSFVLFIPDFLPLLIQYSYVSFMNWELGGVTNRPPSEIIKFWKTDFAHYDIRPKYVFTFFLVIVSWMLDEYNS